MKLTELDVRQLHTLMDYVENGGVWWSWWSAHCSAGALLNEGIFNFEYEEVIVKDQSHSCM